MNFKEAFRYQSFLDALLSSATMDICAPSHCLKKTITHHRNAVNADAEDMVEVCEEDLRDYTNDDVIAFMQTIVNEKEALSKAIFEAKKTAKIDIDAAIETNKARHTVSTAMKSMLAKKSNKVVGKGQGKDFKFNSEGNQMPYYYDIETEMTEAFDRKADKVIVNKMLATADKLSSEIDEALINTKVDYEPPYDVNASFEDVMEEFLSW